MNQFKLLNYRCAVTFLIALWFSQSIQCQTWPDSSRIRYDSLGNPICRMNEVIVQFREDFVKRGAFEIVSYESGPIEDFIDDAVIAEIESATGVDFSLAKKVFPRLTPDSNPVSRAWAD